jgi:hypothetical protein
MKDGETPPEGGGMRHSPSFTPLLPGGTRLDLQGKHHKKRAGSDASLSTLSAGEA